LFRRSEEEKVTLARAKFRQQSTLGNAPPPDFPRICDFSILFYLINIYIFSPHIKLPNKDKKTHERAIL